MSPDQEDKCLFSVTMKKHPRVEQIEPWGWKYCNR